MTLTVDLSEEEVRALTARARAQGVSVEQYVRLVLERDPAPEASTILGERYASRLGSALPR
jgi:hypothetical protein